MPWFAWLALVSILGVGAVSLADKLTDVVIIGGVAYIVVKILN